MAVGYELRNVSRCFRNGSLRVDAVKSVDLTIEGPGLVVIQGRSGSGKSTLLQLMGGLDRPDEGQLYFEGSDLYRLREADLTRLRRLAFGFVFQTFNLIPTLSAAENIEAAAAPGKTGARERRRLVADLLVEVGLASRADRLPNQLSGGEQQRVAIARSLINNPKVVLADEPTGNLDSRTSGEIMALLKWLSVERGLSVVIVTHDPTVAAMATRLLSMDEGRLEEASA
jgi:putative ABC transport system ATP-binding protein